MNSKLTRSLSWVPLFIVLAIVVSACAGTETQPASPAPPATPVAAETSVPDEVYLARAQEALARGDYDAAIADLDRAIAEYPVDAIAYLMRGQACEAKGDHDRAIADFGKACPFMGGPLCAEALAGRAAIYDDRGEYDLAIADCDAVIEAQSDYALAYCVCGSAYGHKGERGAGRSAWSV